MSTGSKLMLAAGAAGLLVAAVTLIQNRDGVAWFSDLATESSAGAPSARRELEAALSVDAPVAESRVAVAPAEAVQQTESEPLTGSIAGSMHLNGEPCRGTVVWRSQGEKGVMGDRRRYRPDSGDGEIGSYHSDRIPIGEVELEMRFEDHHYQEAERYLPGIRVRVAVEEGNVTNHDFDFTLPLASVGGRVLTEDGEPPKKLLVTVADTEGRFRQPTYTDLDGRWQDTVVDLGWEYVASLPYAGDRFRIRDVRAGDMHVDFILPVLAQLPVRVFDQETGALILEWDLSYRRRGEEGYRSGRELFSGRNARPSEGVFVIDVLPGELELIVHPSDHGYRSSRIDGVVVISGQPGDVLDVRLERGLELEITMADDVRAPTFEEAALILLEADTWATVHYGDEIEPGEAAVRFGRDDRVFGHGSFYSSRSLNTRFLRFEKGRATLRGLSPGLWRFKTAPVGVTVEPEFVTLPYAGPLEIRWYEPRHR